MHAMPGDPDFMTSLARGLTVIRAFSRQKRQLTDRADQPAHRHPARRGAPLPLHAGQLGYVGTEDRRTFALRPKILELGHAYMTSSPLAASSQPILDRVSDVIARVVLDGDPRRRRDPVHRALVDAGPHHVDRPRPRQPAAGALHVDGPRAARRPAAG
jgi:hypothetical protein